MQVLPQRLSVVLFFMAAVVAVAPKATLHPGLVERAVLVAAAQGRMKMAHPVSRISVAAAAAGALDIWEAQVDLVSLFCVMPLPLHALLPQVSTM